MNVLTACCGSSRAVTGHMVSCCGRLLHLDHLHLLISNRMPLFNWLSQENCPTQSMISGNKHQISTPTPSSSSSLPVSGQLGAVWSSTPSWFSVIISHQNKGQPSLRSYFCCLLHYTMTCTTVIRCNYYFYLFIYYLLLIMIPCIQ